MDLSLRCRSYPPALRGAETPRFPRSHAPNPGRSFFTRPTPDCFAIDYPRRALSQARWRDPFSLE